MTKIAYERRHNSQHNGHQSSFASNPNVAQLERWGGGGGGVTSKASLLVSLM